MEAQKGRCKEQVTAKEEMAEKWIMFLTGFSLWVTCSAVPTECHFNAQGLCEYEERHYSLGETWMEQGCMQCTCLHPFGVGCCEIIQQPVDFPPWCKVHVDFATCKVSLVLVSDPRLSCFPGEDKGMDPRHGGMNTKLKG